MAVNSLYKYLQSASLELRNSNLAKERKSGGGGEGGRAGREESRVSTSRNALVHGELNILRVGEWNLRNKARSEVNFWINLVLTSVAIAQRN
jgi:hypothetical protein